MYETAIYIMQYILTISTPIFHPATDSLPEAAT